VIRTEVKKHSTILRVFVTLTLISLIGSAGCWLWATHKTKRARDELSHAIARGDYEASSRNEWPALDWFVASFVFLLFAIIVGVIALVEWLDQRNATNRQRTEEK
jgi:hypothetical protein